MRLYEFLAPLSLPSPEPDAALADWLSFVLSMAKGYTVGGVSEGAWADGTDVARAHFRAYRIACSPDQASCIAHYMKRVMGQRKVMYWEVAQEVRIV